MSILSTGRGRGRPRRLAAGPCRAVCHGLASIDRTLDRDELRQFAMDPRVALHGEGKANEVAADVHAWGTSSFSTDGSINDALSMLSGDYDSATSISGTSASMHEQDSSRDAQQVPSSAQWSLGLSISESGTIVRAAGRRAVPLPVVTSVGSRTSVGGGNCDSTGSSESSLGSGSSEILLAAVPTVSVPESALAYLDHSLGGPVRKYCVLRYCERCCINRVTRDWFHRRIRLRIWLGAACGQTITGGYLLQYFFSLVGSDLWTKVGYVGLVVWTAIGAFLVEGSLQAALAVVDGHANAATPAGRAAPRANSNGDLLLAESRPSPRGSHFRFMTMLLKSEVTEATAASVSRGIKLARLQSYGYMVVIVACYLIMLLAVSAVQEVDWYNMMQQFVAIAGMCLCPCTAMVLSGWLLFISLPCMIVADHVRMSTHQVTLVRDGESDVQRRRPWNAMMTAVQEAHVETIKLAAVVSPLLTVMGTVLGLVTIWFLICALLPRKSCPSPAPSSLDDCILTTEGSPGKIVLDHFAQWTCFCFSGATAVFLEWQMFGPADVTLACDELIDAIRSVMTQTDGNGKAVLLDPQSLVRIEGIARFAEELNRGQGLGFVFRKKRVTPQLVSGVLAASVLWMVLAFPALAALSALMACPEDVIEHMAKDDNSTCPGMPDVSGPAVWTIYFIPLMLLAAGALFRMRHPNASDRPLGGTLQLRV
eukprot:COSAG02_NODE_223_length_28346_cov_91.381846_3_plen_708_part_00